MLGGLPGVVLGLVAAVATHMFLRRLGSQKVRLERRQLLNDLPFALELMGACLRAGCSLLSAIEATSAATGGPLAGRLAEVSGRLRLGATPASAWHALGTEPVLTQWARAMTRTADTGAPMAEMLTRLADDTRHTAHATSMAAARRVGVYAVAPLGLCFLPAFVLLGIVPTIAG
ncbi:type II secretion system F family protein, partial [Sinosporangium siamense]|uniref:type II secretion system F family protein n=1 Tax=Sinosporangium siamense TaxID=1367973 RepID=UPI001EF2A398